MWLCLSNFKETRLRGWRHHAIRKHCHTNIMTWVQATRTHIKTWAWGLAHVTRAVRRQTQMSPRVCCPASPLTSLRPMRIPVSKTQGWDAEEEDLKLASGRLTRVHVHTYGRSEGVKSRKLVLNLLSSEVYNTKKLETDDLLLFFWILGQSETAGFSESSKASTKQLFHMSNLQRGTPSVTAFASNNPVQYSSVSGELHSLSPTIHRTGISGPTQFPKPF